jgi:hypothetical protein
LAGRSSLLNFFWTPVLAVFLLEAHGRGTEDAVAAVEAIDFAFVAMF